MKFTETALPGVYLIELEPIGDSRGHFSRVWCQRELKRQGLDFQIAQVNSSYNAAAGTIRGLHYQHDPHAEIKMISCTGGSAFDVAVDVRPNSPTYLQWFGAELNAHDNRMLYIPAGFAHGYQALADDTRLSYLVSAFYEPGAEDGYRYDDPVIGIDWPAEVTSVSEKDAAWPLI